MSPEPKERAPVGMTPLRAARQKAGLSLDALADKAGVSRATLWNAEKDPARLSDQTAAAVAHALGVDAKLLRPRMSLAVIDITAVARTLKPVPAADRVTASVGVLGGLSDPEDPVSVRTMLQLLFSLPRKPLNDHVALLTTPKGRTYIMLAAATGEGERQIAFLHELEWRLGRGEVELEIYARPPEVIQ